MQVVDLPEAVSIKELRKALAQPRDFQSAMTLMFGPGVLDKITVKPENYATTRALLKGHSDDLGRKWIATLPVLRLWLRENPKLVKKLIAFIDTKTATSNGHTAPATLGGLPDALRPAARTARKTATKTGTKRAYRRKAHV